MHAQTCSELCSTTELRPQICCAQFLLACCRGCCLLLLPESNLLCRISRMNSLAEVLYCLSMK